MFLKRKKKSQVKSGDEIENGGPPTSRMAQWAADDIQIVRGRRRSNQLERDDGYDGAEKRDAGADPMSRAQHP